MLGVLIPQEQSQKAINHSMSYRVLGYREVYLNSKLSLVPSNFEILPRRFFESP